MRARIDGGLLFGDRPAKFGEAVLPSLIQRAALRIAIDAGGRNDDQPADFGGIVARHIVFIEGNRIEHDIGCRCIVLA